MAEDSDDFSGLDAPYFGDFHGEEAYEALEQLRARVQELETELASWIAEAIQFGHPGYLKGRGRAG